MNINKLKEARRSWLQVNAPYSMCLFNKFNYEILSNCIYYKKRGRGSNHSVNEAWIMFDTETSKKPAQKNPEHDHHNHVVAWTISIRFLELNIVTLYGHKPSELVSTLLKIHGSMAGEETVFYCHNLPYDYMFLRLFLYQALDYPESQLNIKSHYPLYIKFKCGITLKDSLMLAQRKLERWAADLGVISQKKTGFWNYDKIRNQSERFSLREKSYIEHDTLAGVECLNKMANILNKTVSTMPYTATGIVRNDLRNIGKDHRAHDRFKRQALTHEQYEKAVKVFHGGYTHGNRYWIETTFEDDIICYDFASSYPYCLLAFKYPCEKFTLIGSVDPDYILKYSDTHAYMFRLTMVRPRLKDGFTVMPFLQFSKCTDSINAVVDNGRIIKADFISIYTTEISLPLLLKQYTYDEIRISEAEEALKDYLPRWYTDYVFKKFEEKTLLKDQDPVLYSIAKARLNSIYGCSCMKVKTSIKENYETGEYYIESEDPEIVYNKYINKRGTILNYIWGVYCTEYASINLHKLGECIEGEWLYSDTDSCYASGWNLKKLAQYNENCRKLLEANGYGSIYYNGKEYCLGVAEFDGEYTAMRICGAKRYCCRKPDGSLKLTVAGVPKTGVNCLRSIEDFTAGLIFPGTKTGKLTHTYYYTDHIYIDDQGNETGDSIDLTPCDYLLDSIDVVNSAEELIDMFNNEEVTMQVYE